MHSYTEFFEKTFPSDSQTLDALLTESVWCGQWVPPGLSFQLLVLH